MIHWFHVKEERGVSLNTSLFKRDKGVETQSNVFFVFERRRHERIL